MAEGKNNWIILLVIIILAVLILALVLASLLTKTRLNKNDEEWRDRFDAQISNDYERMRVALWQTSQGKPTKIDITVCCIPKTYVKVTNQVIFTPLPGY